MTTVRNILDIVQARIGLAGGGPGVQLYGDGQVLTLLQQHHDDLFSKYFFSVFRQGGDNTYDIQSNGSVGDISALVSDYNDIEYVWLNNCPSPLPVRNVRDNPAFASQPSLVPTGAPYFFKIVPSTTTGSVVFTYRAKPADFLSDTDIVLMDKNLLAYSIAYDYLNSLQYNQAEEQKLLQMFQDRLAIVLNNDIGDISMESTPYTGSGWQEV